MPAQKFPLTTPFKNIALALSGGGFRAASFSLGTLSYLERLKLDVDRIMSIHSLAPDRLTSVADIRASLGRK